ncbi:MAG: hypothetical protein CVU93_02055 [Firmicutes bacterium HGW-Firmicutes-18]|nr:MAG: hypothetical protein CVU93_02055 [Firmicutes bacterium HGW-Firmicutes-18]
MRIAKIMIIIVLTTLVVVFGVKFFMPTDPQEDIVVEAGSYEHSYIDVITGQKTVYTKEVEKTTLPIVLNNWISDLNDKNVTYGNAPDGNSILEGLEIESAYLVEDMIIITMNNDFLYFDEGYSQPVYFINGLLDIMWQVTEASYFSIEVEGYNESIIHPDGLMIKDIMIRGPEN